MKAFGDNLGRTANGRDKQLREQKASLDQTRSENEELKIELQSLREEIEEMQRKQKEIRESRAITEARLIEEAEALRRRLRLVDVQSLQDQQAVADFLGRMLLKEERVAELQEYVPRSEQVRRELEELEAENAGLLETLQEGLEYFEAELPAKMKWLEDARCGGAQLEQNMLTTVCEYEAAKQDALTFVHDVLPFEKVARTKTRPPTLGRKEPRNAMLPGRKTRAMILDKMRTLKALGLVSGSTTDLGAAKRVMSDLCAGGELWVASAQKKGPSDSIAEEMPD